MPRLTDFVPKASHRYTRMITQDGEKNMSDTSDKKAF